MGKYYKAEDVINTLAEQWHFEATIECPYATDDIEEWKQNARELFADLPTIEVSEDCISREELLKAFGLSEKSRKYGGDHSGYQTLMLYEIQDIIENAPSVVPTTEQSSMVGEWENYKDEHRCSECGEVVIGDWYDDEWYDYCPNCGAKMKGAE